MGENNGINWRTGKCIKLPAYSPHAQVGLAEFFTLLSSFCSHKELGVTTPIDLHSPFWKLPSFSY